MTVLTPKQQSTLDFITEYINDHHFPPTLMDICDHFGIGIGSVQDRLGILERKGYIKRGRGKARSIVII